MSSRVETVQALYAAFATGKSFRAPFAHAWKFQDGKAVSFEQNTDTAIQLSALQP
jgi:uncharacterized protein